MQIQSPLVAIVRFRIWFRGEHAVDIEYTIIAFVQFQCKLKLFKYIVDKGELEKLKTTSWVMHKERERERWKLKLCTIA